MPKSNQFKHGNFNPFDRMETRMGPMTAGQLIKHRTKLRGAEAGKAARFTALDNLIRRRQGIKSMQGATTSKTPLERTMGIGKAQEPSFKRAVEAGGKAGIKGSVGAGFRAPSQDEMEEMINPGSSKKRKGY